MTSSELLASAGADTNPLFMQLLESAPDPIIIADQAGNIVLANAQAGALFGYERDELLNQEMEILLPERYRAGHVGRRKGFATHAAVRPMGTGLDIVGRRKDGTEVPLDIKLSPLRTNGELLITAVIRDITDQKAYEKKLRDHNLLLAEKNKELEQFAFVASHDLQEPLRKILAFGDRLKAKYGEVLSDEGKDYVARMHSAAQRMSRLINDLLQYSRLATANAPMEAADLNDVLRGVLSDLEFKIEKERAKIEISQLPPLFCIPSQMRQLFQNLIGNALKFRGEADPVIRIANRLLPLDTRTTGAPAYQLEIVVSDNGIGFDAKYADRIFNVFERLNNSAAYDGTGIGLAICKRIVERHEGAISAAGTLGQGATFTVTLPLTTPQIGVLK